MTQTSNLGLYKPDSTDLVDVSVLNNNMDILDGDVKPDAVQYNTAQTLTSGQQAQARANIGAADSSANNALLFMGQTSISSSDDLNNYTLAGNYYATSTVAATLLNSPLTTGFALFVIYPASASSAILQIALARTGTEYRRYSLDSGVTWQTWNKVYKIDNTDIGAVSSTILSGTLSFGTSYFTDSSSYVKKQGNIVTVALLGTAAATWSGAHTLATLPSGFRPGASVPAQVWDATNNAYYLLNISNTGTIGTNSSHPSISSGALIRAYATFNM